MATSLEELLAKEGFRAGRSGTRSRPSFKAEAVSMPRRGPGKSDSPSGPPIRRTKTEKIISDVPRYILRGESPRVKGSSSRRPTDDLVRREKLDSRLMTEHHHRDSEDVQKDKKPNNEVLEDVKGNEIFEVGVGGGEIFKDIYSDKAYYSERTGESSKGNGCKERYRERKGKEKKVPERHGIFPNKNLVKYSGFSNNNRKIMNQSEADYESSVRGSKNGNFLEDDGRPKSEKIREAVPEIALDEAAMKAVISILNGYVKQFLKDAEFRTNLRHNCLSSLNFIEIEESNSIESKAKANLEQAIATVENALETAASVNDLRTASLQLSVISGLNSNDLKDEYTSETPISRLSACAHIYLSVIYKLRKKDKVSANHLLQVFCDSPFLARTLLLSEPWDYLFFPHLSHLKVWYKQEADFLVSSASKITKLKFLDRVYNEILDSGTYQFAVYYKDWLTEGVESPSVPSVDFPFISQKGGSQDHSSRPGSPSALFSPQPMVSKKLYDAMFCPSCKHRVYEAVENGKPGNLSIDVHSSSPSIEIKQTVICSSEMVQYLGQDIENHSPENAQDNTSLAVPDHGHLTTAEEEWKLVKVSVSPETDLKDEVGNSTVWQETGDVDILDSSSHTKENELAIKAIAQSVFKLKRIEDSDDLTVSELSHSNKAIKTSISNRGLNGSHDYFDEVSIFGIIPQDFVCPLTGQLFEDPVTLETGQTFERESIKKWFNEGNKTCPVTGKTLESPTVPVANFILKRIIDSWKSECCNHLLAFVSEIFRNSAAYEPRQRDAAALYLLEKLLTSFSKEERLTHVRHFISVGGLEYLSKRFEFGDLQEKTLVAALLSCCIEAEPSSRNHIARNIDKQCLFELLHSERSKSRRKAVPLLIDLVCLSRRKESRQLISGLPYEKIRNAMHILLEYLQSSPAKERPLVAVLILHLDLLVEPRKYNIYREEAIDAIVMALDSSLIDEEVRQRSCRALLVLGGHFSAGNMSTESWILKQAGFDNNCEVNSSEYILLLDDPPLSDDEEEFSEEWLSNLSASLLANKKRSFLDTISKCLGSGILDLVRVCLATIAWLSCAISTLLDFKLQSSVFPTLISTLKEIIENDKQIEHQVLASISLINLSKNSEFKSQLMAVADELSVPIQSLAEVSWTAKELHAIIAKEDP